MECIFSFYSLLNSKHSLITICLDFHRPHAACDANGPEASTESFFTGLQTTKVRNATHCFTLCNIFIPNTCIFDASQLRKMVFNLKELCSMHLLWLPLLVVSLAEFLFHSLPPSVSTAPAGSSHSRITHTRAHMSFVL